VVSPRLLVDAENEIKRLRQQVAAYSAATPDLQP
jgi:hypothetical protein